MITLGAPRGLIHLRTFINGRAELADYPPLILKPALFNYQLIDPAVDADFHLY